MVAHDGIKAIINLSADADIVHVLDNDQFIYELVLAIMVILKLERQFRSIFF